MPVNHIAMMTAVAAATLSVAATAQSRADRDDHASAAESRRVSAELAKIGCTPSKPIEKEDGIYEADDVACPRIGRFDIKLTADFRIRSMTRDE